MPTTVKTGWLHDRNGDKFAPKTLTSQVQTSDGVLIEDKIQTDLDTYATMPIHSLEERVDDIEDNAIYMDTTTSEIIPNVVVPGGTYNPDCHAQYFQITEDGVLSLKPEYRGAATRKDPDPDANVEYVDSISDNGIGIAGSRNAELPKHLVIPEIVDGIVVNSLADGMLCNNTVFEYITLPRTITEISRSCFYGSYFIKEIYNTENITTLRHSALSHIPFLLRANFPNLTLLEESSIQGCANLVYANIGHVTEVSEFCFGANLNMQRVKNAGKITHIGPTAFFECAKIKHFENLSNITNVDDTGFWACGLPYEQQSLLLDRNLGTNAIAPQVNSNDFWSACTYTPCENPLPTYLAQNNPLWKDRPVGKELVYGRACMLFDVIHMYCGLKLLHNNEKIVLSNIDDLENLVNSIDPTILTNYTNAYTHQETVAEKMGLKVDCYASFNQNTLQTLYDSLAAGKYASVTISDGKNGNLGGHVSVIYGVTNTGELMFCNPTSRYYHDWSKPCTYSMPFQNYCVHQRPEIDSMFEIYSL